jgi:trimeric autotransporter adhesin
VEYELRSSSTQARDRTGRIWGGGTMRHSNGVVVLAGVAALLALTATPADPALGAASACAPDPGYVGCALIEYSGAAQTFTLPAGADPAGVLVKLWGAGGGGTTYETNEGGGGGYSQGILDLTGAPSVEVIVGQGGLPASVTANQATGSGDATYGGGGASFTPIGPEGFFGASGGGRSAIRVGLTGNSSALNEVLTAGGGGGSSDGTNEISEQAGAGGGMTGVAGTCTRGGPDAPDADILLCAQGSGGGGNQTAGGPVGTLDAPGAGQPVATAGSSFQGGVSGCNDGVTLNIETECGGGGGGGYYGGAGGQSNDPNFDAPGGGGSGHADPLVQAALLQAATGDSAAGSSQAQYASGIGTGGNATDQNGGNGQVVIEWVAQPPHTPPPTGPAAPAGASATASLADTGTGPSVDTEGTGAFLVLVGLTLCLINRRSLTRVGKR